MYILFRLTSIWRYHVVATINIEHNVRVLTLLDLVYQAWYSLGIIFRSKQCTREMSA